MVRPVRPTRAAQVAVAAAKLEAGEKQRLVLEVSSATRQAIRIRAAQENKTIKGLIIGLLKNAGVPCSEDDV